MAQKLEDIMEDPSKIGINLPPDTVESCYYPIVQVRNLNDIHSELASDRNR